MINVVGIGQNRDNMTLGALKAIEESDVVIGYKKYINQIEDLLEGKEVVKDKTIDLIPSEEKRGNILRNQNRATSTYGTIRSIINVIRGLEGEEKEG